jgi:diguanylate cyclase (GGDEF)-like protein
VLCVDEYERRSARYARAARAAGAHPVLVATAAEGLEQRAGAAVVIGGGREGLELLERLAERHHRAPRLAVVSAQVAGGSPALPRVLSRTRAFSVLGSPLDPVTLAAEVGAALAAAPPPAESTQRVAVPDDRPDFERLTVDPDTGVEAGGYLRMRLAEEAFRARRYARPLSLGLIDIDDLRAFADERGPKAAAALLRHVGTSLLRSARAVDRVGRWAAGAFAVLLPETAAGPAWAICERLRAQVAAEPLDTPAGLYPVRLSAGVAAQARRATPPSDLIARADAALWRAKRDGGDRTIADEA